MPLSYMQTAAVRIQAFYRGSAGRSAAKRRKVGLSLNSTSASLRVCVCVSMVQLSRNLSLAVA